MDLFRYRVRFGTQGQTLRDERFLVFPCAATNVAATRRAATDFIKSLQSYYNRTAAD
jgi:hypothetical protein